MSNETGLKSPVRNGVTKLNFLEARKAALEGKEVRLIFPSGAKETYDKSSFNATDKWYAYELDGVWEIAEKPIRYTGYGIVHSHGYFISLENARKTASETDTIVEYVFENGRLISANIV